MKKRLLSFLICFALILPCAFLLTACGKAKPKSMSVSNAKTEFYYQDEFSFGEEATVEIKMSKGENPCFDAANLVYDAETKTAETDNYKVDYSNFNSNVLGEYDIKVTYKQDGNITYSYKVTVVAKPFADEDVTAADYSGVYDGAEHSISVECSIEGSAITYSTDGVEYSATKPTFKDAGDYTVYFIVDKENYAPPVSGTKTVTISKKEVTLNWGSATFTYDKTEHAPTCTLSGVVQGDVCTISVTGQQTNAGSYTATATNISNANYKLPEETTKGFVINPKQLAKPTLTTAKAFTYNKAEQGLAFESNFEEGIGAIGTKTATVAGRYTYTVGLSNANYVWSDGTTAAIVIEWQINKKDVKVPTLVADFEYNRLPQSPTINDFDETIMTKEGVEKSTNAGSFTLKFALKDNANYYWDEDNIAIISGEKSVIWTIAKATISAEGMRWNYNPPISYDGTEKEVTLIGVPSGIETLYEGNKKTDAGTSEATVTFIYDTLNYELADEVESLKSLYWTIEKINPTYVTPTGIEVTKADGLKLADISLDSFEGFEWLDSTIEVTESGYYTAKYTPADTKNYNVLGNVQVYVNVIDPAKADFTYYVLDGDADQSKDIALVVTEGVWDNNVTEFGVVVNVESSYTTGNAIGATITYNDSDSFVVTKPGEYVVKIKVTKEDYNDFVNYQTIVVEKADVVVYENPSTYASEPITIDDTLSIVKIQNGQVGYNGDYIDGTWTWKEPNTTLLLGINDYVAVFTPAESDYYKSIEVELSVEAERGMPVRTLKVEGDTYTVPKQNSYYNIEVQIPYGESVTVDMSTIKDGFSIYSVEYNEMHNEVFVPISGKTFEIENKNLKYSSSVQIVISEDGVTREQTINFEVVEEYYLDTFSINYTYGTDEIYEVDLMKELNASIYGEIVHIFVEPSVNYTATTYINGILLGSDITNIEVRNGENIIFVIVKDAEGKEVRYIQKEFTYYLPEYYGSSNVAAIVGEETKDMLVVNANGIMGFMFSTEINTVKYPVSLYKMNNANGSYALINLETNLTLNAGANVYKAVLSIPKAAKVVREFVVYDTSAENGYSYDEGVENSLFDAYSFEITGGIYTNLYTGNFEVGIDKPIKLQDIVVKNDLEDKAVVTELINDYLLIKITKDGTAFFKVVKLNKYYIENDSTAVKLFLIKEDGESVTEITDLEETIELGIFFDEIYVKTINPAATISFEHSMLDGYNGSIYAMMAFDAQDIEVAITPSDGSEADEITINIQANAMKVFGITPIKTVETEEVKGTELVASMSGMMMFTGDIGIQLSESPTEPSTATAVDLISNYTFYNAEGEVWAEGDGAKYIKIDVFAEMCMVAKGFDFEEGQPIDPYDSLEGILLETQEVANGYRANMYILAEEYGVIYATMELVEEFTETQIKLSVKDSQGTKLQDFELNLKAVNGTAVLGDYFMSNFGLEYCVGSFVGDTAEYYVDSYTGNIYSYTDGVIGTTILGVLTDYEGYALESKTEGELEDIEIGTEFVFQGEDVMGLTYLLAPNDELKAAIAALEDDTLSISVDVTEGVKVLNMEDAIVKPIYSEITGDVNSFDNMGMQCIGLKLIYNEGEANEFEIIVQCAFASLDDVMGSM